MTATAQLAPVFAALGDDMRWAILTRLGQAPASASALARELPISRQAIVKHLELLSAAKVADLLRPGQVLLRLAVTGFGVLLPPPGQRPA